VIATDATCDIYFVLAVASTELTWTPLFNASVIFTSAPNLLRASVVKTECSLLISLGAEDCPTIVQPTQRAIPLS
jgi:hypothetical protein